MNLCAILSDAIWFWVLQAILVLFAAFAWFQNRKRRRRNEPSATRGAESMQYFLVICGLIIALPVAICASVDVPLVKGHRALWILFDGVVVGYVCLLNGWFRNNVLLPFVDHLANVENR